MASSCNPSSSRTDRKTVERNRRNEMKALYSKLNSLVPHHKSKEAVSLSDQLDEAAKYVKKLQINLEKLKEKKDSLMGVENPRMMASSGLINLPNIEIHEVGSSLQITLVTGLDCQYMFNQTIRFLYGEGAEIVNASFSAAGDKIFHTIHSKMEDAASGGYGTAGRSERLKKFVQDAIASSGWDMFM